MNDVPVILIIAIELTWEKLIQAMRRDPPSWCRLDSVAKTVADLSSLTYLWLLEKTRGVESQLLLKIIKKIHILL